jgi:Piwi domain
VSHKIRGSGVPMTGGKRAETSCARKNTMIVGADVTHPKEGQQLNCPSIAGVVATDKDESSCYLASARLQKGKQEVSLPEQDLDLL